MEGSEELSYYEYWTTKEVWPLWRALAFLYEVYQFRRSWKAYENSSALHGNFMTEVKAKLLLEDAYGVFSRRECIMDHFDDDGHHIPAQLVEEESEVYPSKFLQWAYAKGYQLPYDFMVFIGVKEEEKIISNRDAERIDKAVCQGIGKTLWSIYPNMTNEEMQQHDAIRGYGRVYSTDTTLRRWLSEVDPRTAKRGRKRNV